MTVAQTSLAAFESILPTLSGRRKQVLEAMEKGSDYSFNELVRLIGLPINCITPRILELRKLGFVSRSGVRKCSVTGSEVYSWRREL